jgi:predicted NAD-dependent protein-ADP-ribosyltransferase YbiA (DUF1768 family)
MSKILWKDAWRPYQDFAIHDDKTISGFFGDYRWLSNFHPCVLPEEYPTVENAYMAEKVLPECRDYFRDCSPTEAKKNWRDFSLLDSCAAAWDSRKDEVMLKWLQYKFSPEYNPILVQKLKDTGSRELIELNYWQDIYWGVDIKLGGKNKLGKMIMNIRSKL